LLHKNIEFKIYKTITSPVGKGKLVTDIKEHRLKVSENRVLKKKFGPTR
jgi:hypothetical protein